MHKTGSSSVQNALACLKSNDFHYCDFNHPNHSMAFYTLFSKNYLNYHEWKKQGLSVNEITQKRKEYLQIFNKYLTNKEHKKLIFSAESISLLQNEEKKDMIRFFKDYGCEIIIICYVRDPSSFAYSSFQQDIKTGSTNIKERYSPNYFLRIDEFKRNPIIKRLFVRDYKNLKDGNIVTDLFYILGIENENNVKYFENLSLSISALKILFLINKNLNIYSFSRKLYDFRLRLINIVQYNFMYDSRKYKNYFSLNIDYDEVSYLRENFSIYYTKNDKTIKDSVSNTLSFLEDLSDVDSAGLTNLANTLGVECNKEKPESWIQKYIQMFFEYK